MRQKTRILIYILIAIAVVIMCTLAMLNARQADKPASSAQEHIDLGRIYLTELSYEKAVLEFTEAIEIEPLNADAYLGLAEAYAGMGDMEKAVEVLEEGYGKTGDVWLKDMIEKLIPFEEEETTFETMGETTIENMELETTATVLYEEQLANDIKELREKLNSVYTADQLTITMLQAASMAGTADPKFLYLPDYFFANIDENITFINTNYYRKQNGLIEIIDDFYYMAYRTEQQYQPYDRKYLISGRFDKRKNNIWFIADENEHSFNCYAASFAMDMICFFNLPNAADVKYDLITDYNEKEYIIVNDDLTYTSYICGDNFQGFYQNFRSEGKICDYFWTDISENSYTIYLIFSGTFNGTGNFNVIKCVVNLGYPDDFDISLLDKIHEIDEVKSAITNIGG